MRGRHPRPITPAPPPAGRRGTRPGLAGLLLALTAVSPAAGQRLNIRNFTSLHGLPQRQILSLHQDRAGYLWIGTYSGLSRYDGRSFRTFTTDDGLSSNVPWVLREDREGRLLIGTLGGGLCVRTAEGFDCRRRGLGLADDDVRDLAVDRTGVLWVATEGGLTRLGPGAPRHFGLDAGLPSAECHALAVGADGALWVGTARGLARQRGERFEPIGEEILRGRSVDLLLAGPRGLLVGTDRGLWLWRDGSLIRPALPAAVADAAFTSAAVGPDGGVWIGTRRGLLRDDGGTIRHFTQRQGLQAEAVLSVLVDREGTIWAGGDGALGMLIPGPFEIWAETEGLPHPFARALTEDAAGRLWVGTRSGLAWRDGERFRRAGAGTRLAQARVYALAPRPGGGLLVGTAEGLFEWRDHVLAVHRRGDGLPDDIVVSLLPEADGTVWVGTQGGLARWRAGKIEAVPEAAPLAGNWVIDLEHDGRGRVWAALRSGGVAILAGGRLSFAGGARPLTRQAVWSLDRAPDGTMWLATNGDGVLAVSDATVRHLTHRDGLIHDFVWSVLADGETIWLFTSRGLDRYAGGRFIHPEHGDGMVDLEGSAGAAWKDSGQGDLWFGTASGLVRYVPGTEVARTMPPPVVLESVRAPDGRLLEPGAAVPYRPGTFTFHFASLSLRGERSVRHRYRLRGLADSWSDPTAESTVHFARLPPGEYTFEVQASRDGERWTAEPAAFAFTVSPARWQTWWFRLLTAVAAGGLLAAVVRRGTRRLEGERRRLARLVEKRTAELREKNARLERLAVVDELTGVSNRRHFFAALRSEIDRLGRSRWPVPLGLLLLDLDHFKQVNDTFGHLVGDEVLREAGRRICEAVRDTDLVARYGGEEFAVLLPMTEDGGAATLAQRILSHLAGTPLLAREHAVPLTASIGAASVLAGGGQGEQALLADLVSRADAALYRAKHAGRNRLVVAGPATAAPGVEAG